jgi:hypothetical protein
MYQSCNPGVRHVLMQDEVCNFVLNVLKLPLYSTRAWITAFVPLSLRERIGVRAFKKAQIVTVCSITVMHARNVLTVAGNVDTCKKPANRLTYPDRLWGFWYAHPNSG